MNTTRSLVLNRINEFLARHNMGRGAFGLAAVGCRDFIRDLENGKPVGLNRIEKAELFMAAADKPAGHGGAAGTAQEAAEAGKRVHGRNIGAETNSRQREAIP
mgnify:CR=1